MRAAAFGSFAVVLERGDGHLETATCANLAKRVGFCAMLLVTRKPLP